MAKQLESRRAPKEYKILNVELWNADGVLSSVDLLISNGQIVSISDHSGSTPSAGDVDGTGLTLMPAGVDVQTHLRVPGQAAKETPLSALKSAVHGGYAAVLNMPNTKPVLDSPERIRNAQMEIERAENETGVKVFWSAAVTVSQKGEKLAPLRELASTGVRAFTDDGLGVASSELMHEAFALLQDLELPLLQHAEFPGHGGVLAPSEIQRRLGVTAYTSEPEWQMVERDLSLLKRFPQARYHVLHVSSARTVDLVMKAKGEGLRVTAEVSPHHLFFTTDDIDAGNSAFKMNPPIRSSMDRECLRKSLREGALDFVATDHAPHEMSAKSKDFDHASFGTIGLETALRVLLSLVRGGELSRERAVEVFSTRPASFLGVESMFGWVKPGRYLHAVLVDVNSPASVVTEKTIIGNSKNSCFLGSSLPGRIHSVFQPDLIWHI